MLSVDGQFLPHQFPAPIQSVDRFYNKTMHQKNENKITREINKLQKWRDNCFFSIEINIFSTSTNGL